MKNFDIQEIGQVRKLFSEQKIILNEEYKEGLENIDGFSHLVIIWWANKIQDCEIELLLEKPYTNGPSEIGIFATRTQIRPNPICISVIEVKRIDYKNGTIYTHYIDADDLTSVIDIKPYSPGSDRVRTVGTPEWCSHWPQNYEESAMFDWDAEFNF